MYTQQGFAGYPPVSNIWGTGAPSYSSQSNNVTNIFNGGGGTSTSIFGGSTGTVNYVPMNSIMTAPFGAQVSSGYGISIQSQQQQAPDYTGKMMDMMMGMCMMMFQKKLNGDSSSDSSSKKTEVVIEGNGNSEKKDKNAKAKDIGYNVVKGGLEFAIPFAGPFIAAKNIFKSIFS